MAYDNLDDAAEAALFMLSRTKSPTLEHLGALYQNGDGVDRTNTIDGGRTDARGALAVPRGSLLALFHNHPPEDAQGKFSEADKDQARRLNVPSYISTTSGRTKRFDPNTGKTEDVLATFPIEEFKAFLMKRLLNREPDDPRGLLK